MTKKVLIVTGGARGIGAATCIKAAEQGYAVCVNYRANADAANDVVGRIKKSGGQAIAVQADVSSEEQIVEMFKQVDAQLGTVTALVNNAGLLERAAPVQDLTAERLLNIFGTNVVGPFICSREAIKRMAFKNGGKGGGIVNLSSILAKYGSPNEYNDYAASKAAVEIFTLGLARELAGEGIRVNGIRPSLIVTDMVANVGRGDKFVSVKETHPMKRAGEAGEVADAILWLLSEQTAYISGTIIDINGGR